MASKEAASGPVAPEEASPRESAKQAVSLVGSTLGVFDASKVKDLGLPTIGTEPGPVGPGGRESSSAGSSREVAGPSSSPQKFQLGETLPVVPSRLVR